MEIQTTNIVVRKIERPYLAFYFDIFAVIALLGMLEFVSKLISSGFDIYSLNQRPESTLISVSTRLLWLFSFVLLIVYHLRLKTRTMRLSFGELMCGVKSSENIKNWTGYAEFGRSWYFVFHFVLLVMISLTFINANFKSQYPSLTLITIPSATVLLFVILIGRGRNKISLLISSLLSLLLVIQFISILVALIEFFCFVLGIVLTVASSGREKTQTLPNHEIQVLPPQKVKFLLVSIWPPIILIAVELVLFLRVS